ncbi:MAG: nucleotidyltransferase family protein [Bacteroidia bacterium]
MISAILLAAGASRRMGKENKLLLPFRDKPLVAHIADEIIASQPGEVVVVTGHESLKISDVLSGKPVKIVFNPNYLKGMTTSIQAGVAAANEHSSGYMICLSDQPLIYDTEYKMMTANFLKEKINDIGIIQVPVFEEKRGNPVIFSSIYREAILQHQHMEGCREIILQNQIHVRQFAVGKPHILKDIDTPEDYERL